MKEGKGMADESPPMHFEDIITKTGDAAPTLPPLTMPIEEAMRTQRALRRLKPDPVDDALVLRLIEFALKAPTSRNAQNWEFVLVKDYAVKVRLARLYRIAWSIYGRISRRLTASDSKMQRQIEAVQWQVEHFEEIPVLVVACLRGIRPVWPPLVVTNYYGSI
jgi:nitroreductase